MTVKTIFPMTRIHEPMKVDVDLQNGKVADAWIGATLFRGFEAMMIGRDPRDAALFTQRICGICSSAHAVVASMALQQAYKVEPPPNGQIITNLIFAADIIQNHLRHFYLLLLLDYVKGPDYPPYTPRLDGDYRLPKKINDQMMEHHKDAVVKSARAHEMLAVFGAKIPMQQTIMTTGVTEKASAERILAYSAILKELAEWVDNVYLPDAMTIAEYYKDYYNIGSGYGNFISYGLFPQPITAKLEFAPGIIKNKGSVEPLDLSKVGEEIKYSWYKDTAPSSPLFEGQTVPDRDKEGAYSWVKAPRYDGLPFEGGPLARGWINGDYRRGISVMDRIVARALETKKICRLAAGWLEQLTHHGPTLTPFTPPMDGDGVGLTDAMRGPLGHWVSVRNGKIRHYQIVTPTTWNFSPRDSSGRRGPVEEALVGTQVAKSESLIEVGRVIRSLDPCFTCAVHIIDAPKAASYPQ
ncbi:nickel-dependent hydrogenase large subunit [Dendrosporobacter sp. 1207_IL3150]|uniref:nickel-dependent hydrogenase large subunit n=1 Tax=Dendrosporobacter sp. 1207_IL3150 TaxID=3084054 RepID=UPI002FD948BB